MGIQSQSPIRSNAYEQDHCGYPRRSDIMTVNETAGRVRTSKEGSINNYKCPGLWLIHAMDIR